MKPIRTLTAITVLAALSGFCGAAEAGDSGTNAQPGRSAVYRSPYLPGSPVFGASPYRTGPVLGGVFFDGDSSEPLGGPVFAPAAGITCDARRHACWSANGIDRHWTGRFFGLKI